MKFLISGGECNEKNLLAPIYNLRPEGKRDLYGLCTPKKEGEDSFENGREGLMCELWIPIRKK